jgi:hypothetical protein
MYKIALYVPESHLEAVKQAMFDAGAGRIGDYEHCCWQTKGTGQFRPLNGANPHIGSVDEVSIVDEYLVELVCENDLISDVIASLKQAHPYEEPAFAAWEVLTNI